MDDVDGIDSFDDQVAALERSLGGAAGMAAAFEREVARMGESIAGAGREAGTLSRGISGGLRRSFDGLLFDGMRLSDALKGVGQSMVNAAYSAAIRPITGQIGGLIASGVEGLMGALSAHEKGGSFAQGRVMPFASGGVVNGPVTFPMRGGLGLMGEAGPEAIMPLTRGADGRLGVASQGGGRPVNVTMNVTTPDVEGFARSRSQIAAQVSRAIARGRRNL
jgi:phage-related minor tail protein